MCTSVRAVSRCVLWWKIISKKRVDRVLELSHTCFRTRATATSSGREQTEEDKGGVCVCVHAAQCNYAIEGICECRNCHVDSGQ